MRAFEAAVRAAPCFYNQGAGISDPITEAFPFAFAFSGKWVFLPSLSGAFCLWTYSGECWRARSAQLSYA